MIARKGHIAALAYPPYPAGQVSMSNAQLRMQFKCTTSYLFDASIFCFAMQRRYQITLVTLAIKICIKPPLGLPINLKNHKVGPRPIHLFQSLKNCGLCVAINLCCYRCDSSVICVLFGRILKLDSRSVPSSHNSSLPSLGEKGAETQACCN